MLWLIIACAEPLKRTQVEPAEPVCGSGEFAEPGDAEVREGESLQNAVDAVGAMGGGTVVLGEGIWRETLTLDATHAGVRIVGRCRELTTLDGSKGSGSVIDIAGDAGTAIALSGLTITGGRSGGITVDRAAVSVDAVDLVDNAFIGIAAARGANVTARDVNVAGTVPGRNGRGGGGISVIDAAMELNSVVIDGSAPGVGDAALFGQDATVSATDLTIDNTVGIGVGIVNTMLTIDGGLIARATQGTDRSGTGIDVVEGSTLVANELNIVENGRRGLVVEGAGSVATLTGGRVNSTGIDAADPLAVGVEVSDGGTLVATDWDLFDNAVLGLAVGGTGSSAEISGGKMTGGKDLGQGDAIGVLVYDNAAVDMVGTELVANQCVSVATTANAGPVTLTDVSILDTRTCNDGHGGVGIAVAGGDDVVGSNVTVDGAFLYGVSVEAGGTLRLDHSHITNVFPEESGAGGVGAVALDGSTLSLFGCLVDSVTANGVAARGAGTALYLDSDAFTDIAAGQNSGASSGIFVLEGASLSAAEVAIAGTHGFAVAIEDSAAEITGMHVTATQTARTGEATGVLISGKSTTSIDGLSIDESAGFGVVATGAGCDVALTDVTISGLALTPAYAEASGLLVQLGATLRVSDAHLTTIDGPALVSLADGALTCAACEVDTVKFAGGVADGGALTLTDSTVRNISPSSSSGGGVGVYAAGDVDGSALWVEHTEISDATLASVWVEGDATVTLLDSTFAAGKGLLLRPDLTIHGNAIFARGTTTAEGGAGVLIDACELTDAADAALLIDNGSVTLADTTWTDNRIDVVQQTCAAAAVPPSDLTGATTELCSGTDRLSLSLPYDPVIYEPVGLGD